MRRTALALILALAAPAVPAQDATITLPAGNFGKYDPTLSAKQAVMANWEMAASGIRAGEVLSGKIVGLADEGASFAYLKSQAAFAQKTILSRYQGTAWVRAVSEDVTAVDPAILRDMVAATAADCVEGCDAEIAELRTAFAAAKDALGTASTEARGEITAREDRIDAVLLSEQLGLMAEYLDGGDWTRNLPLSEYGMDGATVADRIVGTVTLWRNIEPYVGITDPEVDAAINAAAQTLLRTLRRQTRDMDRLDAAPAVREDLTAAADALAVELRRASALFSS